MKYDRIKDLSQEHFRRLTGVKPFTFNRMSEILKKAEAKKRCRGGRKSKLIIEDQLLLSLEYLREYRTYFHMGQSYGISESAAYKAVKWVENVLIKHKDFALPGRKELLKYKEDEIVLFDVTETPIQRPKKNKNNFTLARKSDIHLKHKLPFIKQVEK